MKMKDYIRLGWDQLQRRKVVTMLCAVGIAIGSASIMVALAFGESIQHYSQQQMSYYLKTDEITIMDSSGDPSGQAKVTEPKLALIRTFPHVKAVASFQELPPFEFTVDNGRLGNLQLIATELDTLEAFDSTFQQGGPSGQENSIILSYGATLGIMDEKTLKIRDQLTRQRPTKETMDTLDKMNAIPYPLYQKQLILKPVTMRGPADNADDTASQKVEIPIRVAGVLKKPEGLPDYMISGNKRAYVSPDMGRRMLEMMNQATGNTAVYSEVKVKVDSSTNVKQVEDLIKKLHLQTQSNLYQEDRMKGEFVIVRLLLTGVGLFVLFVASISIVVAMTMSTHQRRRQIGIMKVLGANLKQIRNMFIVESSLLGMLGGLAGIVLTYWVIWGINLIIIKFDGSNSSGREAQILFISLWILPVGMFFAILTGVLSGLYPAVKASRTDALTAIKRE
ncbi:ABC transporter permease [Paenibacillus hexagrammi]|uniref:ABC transporter permease n=1 Tax=Paenibacillus hexagrammi TaxID=2908839 RepID=A0ABY3SDY7_9BACL|nr:ABC transporter permease [Paenibacillus sp. YPD9-1]UJF31618.1 ABC transporter permease [Paenibacillus sp. YPD9-1]